MALDPVLSLSTIVIIAALTLVIVVRSYHDKVARLKERLAELETSKRSLSTTYGRISEQFAPFMSRYPYDAKDFRFLGTPVDGVQFTDDRVVFVEFKTNTSRLSPRQQRVKELIEQGAVEWHEFRLDDDAPAPPTAGPETPPSDERWGALR